MPEINIRPTHSAVKSYYDQLRQLDLLRLADEGRADRALVRHNKCMELKLVPECGNDVVGVDIAEFNIVDGRIVRVDIFPAEIDCHVRVKGVGNAGAALPGKTGIVVIDIIDADGGRAAGIAGSTGDAEPW